MKQTIAVSADKPGRIVTVEAGPEAYEAVGAEHVAMSARVALGIGGRIGEEEWTWVTFQEAREIADALQAAAGIAEAEGEA